MATYLDSRNAESIVRELFKLWKRGNTHKLSLSAKAAYIYRKLGIRVSRWQIWRLEKQFENGNVWVDVNGNVFRAPRGIVAKQEEFKEKFYRLGLEPGRELFREAMKRLQRGQDVSEVIESIVSGELPRLITERIVRGVKGEEDRESKRLHLQNRLIGLASSCARYVLCMKYKTVGHVPLVEHRALTGKLLRRWCSELKNNPNSLGSKADISALVWRSLKEELGSNGK
ncbi:MAG: hypothetical protein QW096_09215 [Thermofilaceae archaeon]